MLESASREPALLKPNIGKRASLPESAARRAYDAVIVGAGPNGLSAAIAIAQAGRSVLVIERAPQVGGGTQTAELTLPGFLHDVCSAVHPLGIASPFWRTLPLEAHGLTWVQPPAALAHPFEDGSALLLERSVDATARHLGTDGAAYQRLMGPLSRNWKEVLGDVLGPLRLPRHPLKSGSFGLYAIRSIESVVHSLFREDPARSLLAGISAHAMLPPSVAPSAAFALVLGLCGHAVGWPIPHGGAQRIADALAALLRTLGGEILVNTEVHSLEELPPAAAVLLDITPSQLLRIGGERLSRRYRKKLEHYRYGPGVFKIDWALSAPIPWRAPECARAATVHVVGSFDELKASEETVHKGEVPARPYVLLAQPSLFDSSRAPVGSHTAWAYCHVPHDSCVDMRERIEAQLERFAPGFRKLVLARHTLTAQQLEAHNPNYVGGDINGGVADLGQLFSRPVGLLHPYRTSDPGVFLCSSATPPGGGVHGLCGYFAARMALRRLESVAPRR